MNLLKYILVGTYVADYSQFDHRGIHGETRGRPPYASRRPTPGSS